jgi:hypothetical protein
MLWTGITLHSIHRVGLQAVRTLLMETWFNNRNEPLASSKAATFQTNYAETVRQNRDHVVLWGGDFSMCVITLLYTTHILYKNLNG